MIWTAASALAALTLTLTLAAQEAPARATASPGEIVAVAMPQEWIRIAPQDLLVMTLEPTADGTVREVIIQLMPPPFSQGWVQNIRTLTRAGWYDGISINRVQDNYVVQWGDPNHDNPEADGLANPLPKGLRVMDEEDYYADLKPVIEEPPIPVSQKVMRSSSQDSYAPTLHALGWQFAGEAYRLWPVHCYGMVGVGRSYSPDTGSGAELYTVIGHAPRHLDRNIALVGRVVGGIEHLSSLPRGKGALGFYADPSQRVSIQSIRVASDLPDSERPRFEYLSTEGATFVRYAEARANRRDPFFIVPAGGADICNIPVPVRRVAAQGE